MKIVAVWDPATRAFHWTLAAVVILSLVIGENDGLAYAIHAYCGYLALLLAVFRLGWGAIGSQHSRFADFLYGRRALVAYTRALARLRPPHFVGHNPLGGWMIVILLLSVALTAVTGILAAGDVVGGDLHEILANLLIAFIAIHVAGVLVDLVLTRSNLIGAMITGNKRLGDSEAAATRPLTANWQAIVLALFVAALGGWGFSTFQFGALLAASEARQADD